MTHSEITNLTWGVADLIRDSFKRGKYQDVIVPLTVLRRIDKVLVSTKEMVFAAYQAYERRLESPALVLRRKRGL